MRNSKPTDVSAVLSRLPPSFLAPYQGPTERLLEEPDDSDKVAIYARYSSESSKESSIERQQEQGATYATDRLGRSIVRKYVDRAVSGTTMVGRHGLEDALRDAKAGRLKILIVEDVDRLARTLPLACVLFQRFTQLGVELHSATKLGRLDEQDIVIRGFFSSQQLERLKFLTRIGRMKAVDECRSPTGPVYGLRRIPFQPGAAEIDPETGPVVRWMFEMRLAGVSKRTIASMLNQRCIPSPRGKRWVAVTVASILRNPRRAGLFIFGKSSSRFDPESGANVTTLNRPETWRVEDVPEWRIVSYEDWMAVQALDVRVEDERTTTKVPGRKLRRTGDFLLSQIVQCPACRSSMSIRFSTEDVAGLGCSLNRAGTKAACSESRTYPLQWVQDAVLGVVRQVLTDPARQDEFRREVGAQRERAIEEALRRRAALKDRVDDLRAAILAEMERAERLAGFPQDMIVAERLRLTAELEDAKAALAAVPLVQRRTDLDDDRAASLLETFDAAFGAVTRKASDGSIRQTDDPLDEARQRAKAALKTVVSKVVCVGFPASRSFAMSVDLRIGELVGDDADAAQTIRTIEMVVHPDMQGGNIAQDLCNSAATLVRSRAHFATELEFALIAPHIPESEDAALLSDVLMHLFKTGLRAARIESAFEDHGAGLLPRLQRLAWSGSLRSIVDALRAGHDRPETLALHYFDRWHTASSKAAYVRRRKAGLVTPRRKGRSKPKRSSAQA